MLALRSSPQVLQRATSIVGAAVGLVGAVTPLARRALTVVTPHSVEHFPTTRFGATKKVHVLGLEIDCRPTIPRHPSPAERSSIDHQRRIKEAHLVDGDARRDCGIRRRSLSRL